MNNPPSYMLPALTAFRRGDMEGALEAAEIALSDRPDHQPLLALGSLAALQLPDPARAVPLLRRHHSLAPTDVAVLSNLATALAETGAREEALSIVSGEKHHGMARLEGYLQHQRGNNVDAIAAYRRAVRSQPGDMQSWNNLGNLLSANGEVDEAIFAFEQAITVAPSQIAIYLNLSELLSKAGRVKARLVVTSAALEQAPEDPDVLTEHGLALLADEQHDEAATLLKLAVDCLSKRSGSSLHAAHVELAILLENLNRTAELESLVSRCSAEGMADTEIAFLQAWWARRQNDFEAAWAWVQKIPDSISPLRVAQLRASIADRLGYTELAFGEFERMNEAALRESGLPAQGDTFREQVTAANTFWTTERLRELPSEPMHDGRRDPVFIVGFPRSGTTLLDTMLMGASELHVMEEQPALAQATHSLSNEMVAQLDADEILALRTRYFNAAESLTSINRGQRLVDKHPLHMAKLPLIHRLFPKAQIILAERHPMDVVLSCFMANFKLNYAMRSFTSLREAAKTYAEVWKSCTAAEQSLCIDVKHMRYERLVANPAQELRPIIEWLGLNWSNELLDHREVASKRGHIKTASYSQVTEPVYKRAVNRWHRYREQMRDVEPIVKPWIEALGYEK